MGMPRKLYILPLLLTLPLLSGCLTTLAISALANSGAGGEHAEVAKETAKEVADKARDTADNISLSAHDVFESWTAGSD
jgi:hypothetical protein